MSVYANREKLHVIMDEIFAVSKIDEDADFRSVLSLPCIPDPERTHVVYGTSKVLSIRFIYSFLFLFIYSKVKCFFCDEDFPFAGLRIGIVVTQSEMITRCLLKLGAVMSLPAITQHIAAGILEQLGSSIFVNLLKF